MNFTTIAILALWFGQSLCSLQSLQSTDVTSSNTSLHQQAPSLRLFSRRYRSTNGGSNGGRPDPAETSNWNSRISQLESRIRDIKIVRLTVEREMDKARGNANWQQQQDELAQLSRESATLLGELRELELELRREQDSR